MKILIVGDWHSELHEEAVFNAFKKLGHESFKFAWHQYFEPKGWAKRFTRLFLKAQNKYIAGPVVSQLNHDLFDFALQVQPDMIFIYRGTHIYAKTVKRLHRTLKNAQVIGYNNDDPFSPQYPWWKWRHYLASVPQYDLTLAYRKHNIAEYLAIGAHRVELLRSWFMPERNFHKQLTAKEKEQYECDVVFIGHYENDGRLECLEEIVRRGYHLRVFGPEWNKVKLSSTALGNMSPIKSLEGAQYNVALNASKVALCFLSKLNRDTYTRRCFEIPAAKTMLLGEYSEDLADLYNEGIDVDFFRDRDELIKKIDVYLRDDMLRNNVASKGYQRVKNDGHDVTSRMLQVIEWTLSMQKEKYWEDYDESAKY